VQVTAGTGALPGAHSLTVSHLAQSQVNSSTPFGTDAAPGTGTLNITVGSNPPVSVNYTSSDKLEDVASRINGLGAGVVASVLNDGVNYRLMISATKSGVANGMTFTESGAGLGFTAQGSQTVAAQDASFTLDNVAITRSSNFVTDAAPGLTLDLRGQTAQGGSPTTITVGLDQAGLSSKVQALVNAYNGVQKTLSGDLAYTGTALGSNTFFGDATLELMQSALSGVFAQGFGNGGISAAQLGIDLAKDGSLTLSFDPAKFSAALAASPTIAQDLFTGNGTPGLAQSLTTMLDSYTRPIDGVLTAKQDSLNKDITYYDQLIQQTTDSANALGARLRAQFAAMEQALSLMQSQSSILLGLGVGANATTGTSSSGSTTSSANKSTITTG
jgi:flagellar hook-associated protein 2